MNEQSYKQLLEESWRRALTPEEETRLQLYLAANPERQQQWEDEAALTDALHRLPNAPLSSNFTALVMQAVDKEERISASRHATVTWWRQWLPKLAPVGLAAVVLLSGANLYRLHNQKQATKKVGLVSELAGAFESPEAFAEFEMIQQLRAAPTFGDEDLVAVLQK